jgi:hypothetical protein
MEVAQQVRLNTARGDVRSRDMTIMLGYSILAILLLSAIYFASGPPGTSAADFTSMVVFP